MDRKTAKKYTDQILAANEETWPQSTGSIVPKGTKIYPITKELLTGEYAVYNLKSHPKAHGLDITLKYPISWKAEEGIRPHIIQKFTGKLTGGIIPMCMVIVNKIPVGEGFSLEDEFPEEDLAESFQEMLPEGAVFIDGKKTELDGEPCIWIKYNYELDRAGFRAGMYTLQFIIFYDGKMFVVQCGVTGLAEDNELLEDAFNSYLPVFQSIANSIVINDKWEKPYKTEKFEDSIMEEAFGEHWLLTLLVSAILTWGIGLTPPILIRYAIFRRPLPKRVVIPLIVFFWVVNITIFTYLGSQSKTHAALFFVAWASYYILHRKYATWQSKSIKTNAAEELPSKYKDDNTVKSISSIKQVDRDNCNMSPTPVFGYIENELDKTAHHKYTPNMTSEANSNQAKDSTKITIEKSIPVVLGRLEKCNNCKKTIGKLEYSYKFNGNTVCLKCYSVLNPENK